jgi:hypothetical protein
MVILSKIAMSVRFFRTYWLDPDVSRILSWVGFPEFPDEYKLNKKKFFF